MGADCNDIVPCMMTMLSVRFTIIFIINVLLTAKFTSASAYLQCECHLLLCCDWLS